MLRIQPRQVSRPKKGKREHRKLTDEEKLKRDRWEEAWIASGKKLPYERTEAHAAAAAKSVEAAPGGGKGNKGKGKGKGEQKCWRFLVRGETCPCGKDCWHRANAPGHP